MTPLHRTPFPCSCPSASFSARITHRLDSANPPMLTPFAPTCGQVQARGSSPSDSSLVQSASGCLQSCSVHFLAQRFRLLAERAGASAHVSTFPGLSPSGIHAMIYREPEVWTRPASPRILCRASRCAACSKKSPRTRRESGQKRHPSRRSGKMQTRHDALDSTRSSPCIPM